MYRYKRLLEIHKIAVNKENEVLRKSFEEKFLGENPKKNYAIADQWWRAFNNTPLYEAWKDPKSNLKSLNDVVSFIKENKDSVERSKVDTINKNLIILSKKYPESKQQFNKFNDKFLSWIASRYGDNPQFEKEHPIEQAIESLLRYQERISSLRQKFETNDEYKKLFQGLETEAVNPSDIINLSINNMEMAIGLADRPKGLHTIIPADYKPKEMLGQFGPWKLWMPLTRTDSIAIAKYDKNSMIPDTDWCTARTFGHNLFYSYVTAGTILFYAIKDGATKDNLSDYHSIGVDDGSILYNGSGSETVDGDNNGMYEEDHKKIFGENFEEIYKIILDRSKELKGVHPAESILDRAALGSDDDYKELIKGAGPEEIRELKHKINDKKISIVRKIDDINLLSMYLDDESSDVRSKVASNENITIEMMKKILGDSLHVKVGLATNPKLYLPENIDILEELSRSEKYSDPNYGIVLTEIAKNEKTPMYIIKNFIKELKFNPIRAFINYNNNYKKDPEGFVDLLQSLAGDSSLPLDLMPDMIRSPLTSASFLEKIYNDLNPRQSDLVYFLRNKNTPSSILAKIYGYIKDDVDLLKILLEHPMVSDDTIKEIKENNVIFYKSQRALNPNTSEDELNALSKENDFSILSALINNPSAYTEAILSRLIKFVKFKKEIAKTTKIGINQIALPPSISEALSFDKDRTIRSIVAKRLDTPQGILARLALDSDKRVRDSVFHNKKTPINIVLKLSKEFGTHGPLPGNIRAREYMVEMEAFDIIDNLYEYQNALLNDGINISEELFGEAKNSEKIDSLARRIAQVGSIVFYDADLTDLELTQRHSRLWAENFINKNTEEDNLSRDKKMALSLAKEIVQESEGNQNPEQINMVNDKLGNLVKWLLKSGFEKEASDIFSIYKEATLRVKADPLLIAVALGLLNPKVLFGDGLLNPEVSFDDEDDASEDDASEDEEKKDKIEKDIVKDILKKVKEFELEKEAAKKKKKKKKKKSKKKKRTPTKPDLWQRAIAAAKRKFDVYPSAYANGWALQWYKKKGGGWRGPKPKK